MASTDEKIRDAATKLAAHRQRPCALLVLSGITRDQVGTFRAELARWHGEEIDLVLFSDGGDIDAAYMLARELHRRAQRLTVYVPTRAKSAATLIAFAADDLVLGPLGELGPLDSQCGAHRRGGVHIDPSGLVSFKAIEQTRQATIDLFEEVLDRACKRDGVTTLDACTAAGAFVGTVMQPILAKIDPVLLGESARHLELAAQYACRLLRRYRPGLHDDGCKAVHRLIHEYASHSFVIDLEELHDLGLPARGCTAEELPIVEAFIGVLDSYDTETNVVGLIPPPAVDAA